MAASLAKTRPAVLVAERIPWTDCCVSAVAIFKKFARHAILRCADVALIYGSIFFCARNKEWCVRRFYTTWDIAPCLEDITQIRPYLCDESETLARRNLEWQRYSSIEALAYKIVNVTQPITFRRPVLITRFSFVKLDTFDYLTPTPQFMCPYIRPHLSRGLVIILGEMLLVIKLCNSVGLENTIFLLFKQ